MHLLPEVVQENLNIRQPSGVAGRQGTCECEGRPRAAVISECKHHLLHVPFAEIPLHSVPVQRLTLALVVGFCDEARQRCPCLIQLLNRNFWWCRVCFLRRILSCCFWVLCVVV